MRMTLLKVDAILRLQLLAWMSFDLVVLILYGFAPWKYPLHFSLIWSTGFYLTHYVLVGLVRRMTETYLGKLCLYSDDNRCKDISVFENKNLKPYKRADDPVLVRRAFVFLGAFGLPSRGLGQMSVACFHFFVLVAYAINYVRFFGHADALFAPTSIYILHGVVTAGGLLMIVKNAGYLISSRHILALLKGIIDFKVAGRSIASIDEDRSDMLESSMKQFRFEENKPPVKACHTCVHWMAKHIAGGPIVVLKDMEEKELLATLLKLRERSPEFADALRALLLQLESDPDHADKELQEFKVILLRSPELVLALHAIPGKPEDVKPKS